MLLTAWLCTTCIGNKTFDQYQQIPTAGWEKNDTLSFAVPPVGNNGLYSVDLGIRTIGSYPFMSLTLIVDILREGTTLTDKEGWQEQRINCHLFDEKGHVKGYGINYYQYHFHVTSLALNIGDSLQVKVRHDMKREILPGISNLGIQLRREQ